MFIEIQRSNVLATDALYGKYRSHVHMIENAVLACNIVMIKYLLRSIEYYIPNRTKILQK